MIKSSFSGEDFASLRSASSRRRQQVFWSTGRVVIRIAKKASEVLIRVLIMIYRAPKVDSDGDSEGSVKRLVVRYPAVNF